jgi:hypothetical protein
MEKASTIPPALVVQQQGSQTKIGTRAVFWNRKTAFGPQKGEKMSIQKRVKMCLKFKFNYKQTSLCAKNRRDLKIGSHIHIKRPHKTNFAWIFKRFFLMIRSAKFRRVTCGPVFETPVPR